MSITNKCVSSLLIVSMLRYFGAYFLTSLMHSSFIFWIAFSSSCLKFGFLKNKLASFVLSHPCFTSLSSTPASTILHKHLDFVLFKSKPCAGVFHKKFILMIVLRTSKETKVIIQFQHQRIKDLNFLLGGFF
jgi:hypothetical protein